MLVPCPECGATVDSGPGPVHAYVPASPGCWRAFGEVQAHEYQRFGYVETHGMVVDAYMAQHVGDGTDRRNRQSVLIHLIGLCAALERGASVEQRMAVLRAAVRGRPQFPVLTRPSGPGWLTVLHMRDAADVEDYARRAREWANSVWDGWVREHAAIRERLDALWRS